MKPTAVYLEAEERLADLRKAEAELLRQLEKAPAGKIHVIRRGESEQYYLREHQSDVGGKYIPKREQKKIRTYLQKSYDQKTLKVIRAEMANLEKFLARSEKANGKIQEIYSGQGVQSKRLIDPVDQTDRDFIEEWISVPFTTKGVGEDVGILTERGERVRSKSELMIANRLHQLGIPYKYECPFELQSGQVIYPDFTLLDLRTRREVYWEHRGMMDNADYANHAIARSRTYGKNGCFIGKNLVITEETSQVPLSMGEIDQAIRFMTEAPNSRNLDN